MINKIRRKILNLGFTNRNFGKKVIHVEAIHLTSEKLKKHLRKYHSKCYCICPENLTYSDAFFGVNMSKKEFYKTLKNKYLELKKMGINLQLHVHLAYFPEKLPYEKKKHMIESAYNFFIKELNITPREIVFGWYSSDRDSLNIAKNLGLRVRGEHLHIYDWWLK